MERHKKIIIKINRHAVFVVKVQFVGKIMFESWVWSCGCQIHREPDPGSEDIWTVDFSPEEELMWESKQNVWRRGIMKTCSGRRACTHKAGEHLTVPEFSLQAQTGSSRVFEPSCTDWRFCTCVCVIVHFFGHIFGCCVLLVLCLSSMRQNQWQFVSQSVLCLHLLVQSDKTPSAPPVTHCQYWWSVEEPHNETELCGVH